MVSGFIAVALALRQLEAGPYGILVALTGAVGVFGFLDLGIGNALIGLFARSHANRDTAEMRALVASSLVFLSVVGLAALIVAVPVIWLMPSQLLLSTPRVDESTVRIAMTIFVASVAFAIPLSLGSKLALGLQIGYQNNLVNVASGLLMLFGAWAGLAFDAGLNYFVAVFATLPTLCNAVQTFVLLSFRRTGVRPDFNAVSLKRVLRLLPIGIPFSVMSLAGALSYQTDALIVAFVVSASAAAAYGLLLRIFNGATVFFTAGLQQFWASTAHALAEGNLAWVRRSFLRVFVITMSLYIVGTAVILLYGREIIAVWSSGEVHVELSLVVAFACWNTYNFAMTQVSFLLNGAGIVKAQAIAALCMTVVNLPLSVFLTVNWGAVGPLYGSLISHALCVGIPTVVLAIRLLKGNRSQ